METTRHFVSTVILVNDGAVALHDHKRLDYYVPTGGHIDPKELPHEAGIREAKEETGITPTIISENTMDNEFLHQTPEPEHVHVENIDVVGEDVYHKHIDFIYYAKAPTRDITPAEGEVDKDAWHWFTKEELQSTDKKIPSNIVKLSIEAINKAEEV